MTPERVAPGRPEPDVAPASMVRRLAPIAALAAVLTLAGVAALLARAQYDDAKDAALREQRLKVVLASSLFNVYFGSALGTLASIAAAPAVQALDQPAMLAYLQRIQAPKSKPFPGGLAWVDRQGIARLSANPARPRPNADVSDRSYFKQVLATGAPFVSEGLQAKSDPRRHVVTMAVPTRDAAGRVTGLLAGAILLDRQPSSRSAIDLGYAGLAVLDRRGQSILVVLAKPSNGALVQRLKRTRQGLLTDSPGLDGQPGHVVAWSSAGVPAWTVAIDRSRASVFASARRSLALALALIASVAALVVGLLAWVFLRARRDADRQRVRELLRSQLASTLGSTTSVSEVSDAVASALGVAFPGALGVMALTAADDGRLSLSAVSDGPLPRRLADRPDVLERAAALAGSSDRIVGVETHAELRQRLGELDTAVEGAAGSVYVLPLTSGSGRRSGVLLLLFGTEHGLDRDEQSLIASHADQAARALERARVQEREHAVAVALQRSLLSEALPRVDGVELAARYEAGSAGLEVGGDWYDVVSRPDGIVVATVGDVAGRGITAATLMGQLRNAFRAYALDHASPAEVLRRLWRHVGDDEMATAVVLTFDPYTRELAYASAGHLPPVLVDAATGQTTLLDAGGGPPLGALPLANVVVAERRLTLPPRAALIAYTDGLIERRGETIDRGIALVADLMHATAQLDADAAAQHVLAEATGREGGEDDVALLVLRSVSVPSRMALEIPADADALRSLRRRMHTWLGLAGLDDAQCADAVLAVSEACNNAIEHAYGERADGAIRVEFELADGVLRMTVEDRGRWRLDADRGPERGRGLPIMRGVMDRVEIERSKTGTRVRLEHRLQLRTAPLAPLGGTDEAAEAS